MTTFQPVTSPTLEAFARLVERYTTLIDGHAALSPERLLIESHRQLAELYAAGLALPSTDVLFGDEEEPGSQELPIETLHDPDRGLEDEFWALLNALQVQLGGQCRYRVVFDPYEAPEEEEVVGNLADDLVEVYLDLRSGLRKWARGDSGGALWEWRFGLESHWGRHVTSALGAINALASGHDLEWPAGM